MNHFYWWLLKEESFRKKLRFEQKIYLAENIDYAVRIITTKPLNFENYRWAINVIDEFLFAISPDNIKISLNSLEIGNKYSSSDLLNFIDSDENIFYKYFKFAKNKILVENQSIFYLFTIVVVDQLGAALSIAKEIKKHQRHGIIVFGGPFVTRFYEKLESITWLNEIVDTFAPGEAHISLPSVLGINDFGNSHVTPDFSDLDLNSYLSPHLVLPYIISHGCKWGKCVFCTHHLSYSGYRSTDLENVTEDLKLLSMKHGVKYISFCDEFLSSSQLIKLADLFEQNDIHIKWSSFVRAEHSFSDQNVTSKLYKFGARLLMFGFESSSQKVLDSMNKGTNANTYAKILESCNRSKIAVRLDFMIGFPGETVSDIRTTYSFIKSHSTDIDTPFSSYVTAVFELREGTPIFNKSKQYDLTIHNILRGDLDDQYDFTSSYGASYDQKCKWREKIIRYARENLNFSLVTPQNKTHQLIFKDLHDAFELNIYIPKLFYRNFSNIFINWNNGITVTVNNSSISVCNNASGGIIDVDLSIIDFVTSINDGIDLKYAYIRFKNKDRDLDGFIKFINFLYRNDYVLIQSSELIS